MRVIPLDKEMLSFINQQKYLILIVCCATFFCCFGNSDETGQTPLLLGFVGGLTGRSSDLGLQGRNGATLAVEEINDQGGINGRPLELITRDDKQDPQIARKVARELCDKGVVAIIGHMTSTMAEAALPLTNENKMLMISPTVSTPKLSGIDDYFFRVVNANVYITNFQAAYAFEKLKLRRMAAIYDLGNRAYTEKYTNNFKAKFEGLGGKFVSVNTFTTGPDINFNNLVHRINDQAPDGLLISAGAIDTAMICQHVRMAGIKIPIMICGWSQTPDLLHHGGPAVEGVIGAMYLNFFSTAPSFLAFKEKFQRRFGKDKPTFAVIFSYEAVMMVKEALLKNPDPKQLKQTILKQKIFQGVQGPFEIDRYGDTWRKFNIITISQKRFQVLEE